MSGKKESLQKEFCQAIDAPCAAHTSQLIENDCEKEISFLSSLLLACGRQETRASGAEIIKIETEIAMQVYFSKG